MGNWIGYGQSTEPDPATGLSPRDIYLVTGNWAIVKQDLKAAGVKVMLQYLKDYPKYQSYFPFRDIPWEELEKTPKFRAHCSNLIYNLSAIIDSLNDTESLVSLLNKSGESHQRHKAPALGFDDLKVAIIKCLRNELSFRFTAECEESWKKTMDVAFQIITANLKQ